MKGARVELTLPAPKAQEMARAIDLGQVVRIQVGDFVFVGSLGELDGEAKSTACLKFRIIDP